MIETRASRGVLGYPLFRLLGTKLTMTTTDHPQTDGITKRVNRVLEDTLRSIWTEAARSWSDQLPMVEFALNIAATPPPGANTLGGGTDVSIVSGGKARKAFSFHVSEIEPESLTRRLSSFIEDRLTLTSRVRDAMASAQDRQKEYSDKHGRRNLSDYKQGSNTLKHRFTIFFAVLARYDAAYTIDLP
ncbi:Pol protein [Phytophthora palmivora]|uniref:Pol protein n=1 Tax=Phytophthora palmivora TaxID=4796 RepID=A0A2P4XDC4_9STRA|nr:Pol protein [Phytophthora palmivora]